MSVKNEALLPLFGELKELLSPYAQRLTVRRDEPGYLELWSDKEIEIAGRRRKDVGFYFMPLYAEDDPSSVFGADLLATRKGKSCFHIKRLTPELKRQIDDALAAGWRLYEQRGWV